MVTGVLLSFWATPTMTVGHFIFSAGMTIYAIIGLKFEERDLIDNYGDQYFYYKQQVRMFLPLKR